MSATDARSPEALTIAGILMSLDASVRSLSAATRIEDLRMEAQGLVRHAQTVDRLREEIRRAPPQRILMSSMHEAHDALLEAAATLTKTETLALPF